MTEIKPRREIKSFVRREGRLTPSQQRALENLWPRFGIEPAEKITDLNALFQRNEPKVIEIGFGNGSSLVEMASQQPEFDFIGIEVHRPGVGQLLNAIEDKQLNNLRVVNSDAVAFIKQQVADESLHRVQIFFPDPWHKKRHHKRRIIQPDFIALLAEKLAASGYLHLATDWQNYAEQMLQDLSDSPKFNNLGTSAGYIERPSYRPLTKFEQRGHGLGHGVWDLLFQRGTE